MQLITDSTVHVTYKVPFQSGDGRHHTVASAYTITNNIDSDEWD